jgi:hypothetical protein
MGAMIRIPVPDERSFVMIPANHGGIKVYGMGGQVWQNLLA